MELCRLVSVEGLRQHRSNIRIRLICRCCYCPPTFGLASRPHWVPVLKTMGGMSARASATGPAGLVRKREPWPVDIDARLWHRIRGDTNAGLDLDTMTYTHAQFRRRLWCSWHLLHAVGRRRHHAPLCSASRAVEAASDGTHRRLHRGTRQGIPRNSEEGRGTSRNVEGYRGTSRDIEGRRGTLSLQCVRGTGFEGGVLLLSNPVPVWYGKHGEEVYRYCSGLSQRIDALVVFMG